MRKRPERMRRWRGADVVIWSIFSRFVNRTMGHEGPRIVIICRNSGIRVLRGRDSMMAATFCGVGPVSAGSGESAIVAIWERKVETSLRCSSKALGQKEYVIMRMTRIMRIGRWVGEDMVFVKCFVIPVEIMAAINGRLGAWNDCGNVR
jgi:hypothetical protein